MAVAGCGDDSGAGTSPATAPQQQQPATTVADSGATATFDGADGPVTLRLAIARTEAERSRGLMFVDEMDTDLGMIFIWEAPVEGGFWMKNTYIPLSIAFIDADRRIIDIQDMDPESLEPRAPSSPYLFAIEANRGFFAANGIEVGSLVLLEGVSR